MPNELDPMVEQWYLRRDKGELFRVVAMDAATEPLEPYAEEVDEPIKNRAR